jgi:hypothetical protein
LESGAYLLGILDWRGPWPGERPVSYRTPFGLAGRAAWRLASYGGSKKSPQIFEKARFETGNGAGFATLATLPPLDSRGREPDSVGGRKVTK